MPAPPRDGQTVENNRLRVEHLRAVAQAAWTAWTAAATAEPSWSKTARARPGH